MKLTDQQKFDLTRAAWLELMRRPQWPTEAPPARDGSTKTVRKTFGLAVWARAAARDLVYVLEQEDDAPKPEMVSAGAPGTDANPGTPF